MESNMKKVFQYMTTLLLLLVVGTSCEEGNDNWRIITDAQPGAYITGDATIYSATATSSQLVAAPLDGAPEGTNVIGIYTWLKSNGSFTILNVDEEGNEINYGKGDVVASTPAETVALAAGGTPFTVAEDGLYYVAMNKADNQLTIIPATFGIIGDATPLQWNGETAMQASYNDPGRLLSGGRRDGRASGHDAGGRVRPGRFHRGRRGQGEDPEQRDHEARRCHPGPALHGCALQRFLTGAQDF